MPRLDLGLLSIDANVAADFAVIDRLDLPRTLFEGRLLISDFVTAELARAQMILDFGKTASLPAEVVEFLRTLREQHRNLGIGELGAICVAQQHGAIVLTNDKEARKLATELNLEVCGSLGILRHATAQNVLTAADAIRTVEQMLSLGSWFGADLVDEFKRSVGG